MAGESPFLKYSGCVAAANYWNPASALYGPYGSGQFLGVQITSARTVTVVSATGAEIFGILQNTPAAGQAAVVAFSGISKAVAGGAWSLATATYPLMTDTHGRLVAWVAGAGNFQVAEAIDAPGAADTIGTVRIFNPPFKVVT